MQSQKIWSLFMNLLFFSFLFLSKEYAADLPSSWYFYISTHDNIFLNLYSSNCKSSQKSNPKFNQAARYFNDVPFISVNCDFNPSVCNFFHAYSTPSFILKKYNISEPIEFIGKRTVNEFINFIEMATGKSSTFSSNQLKVLTPYTIDNFIQNNKYALVLFKNGFSYINVLNKIIRMLTNVYENTDIKFGEINCINYYSSCDKFNNYANLALFKDGKQAHLFKTLNWNTILDKINSECNFSKMSTGFTNVNVSDKIKSEIEQYVDTKDIEYITDNFLQNIIYKMQENPNLTIDYFHNQFVHLVSNAYASRDVLDELYKKMKILEYFSEYNNSKINLHDEDEIKY